eukprot:SM000206S06273  [mRNA]  locus=s206:161370:161931:+ [translate_table: standard]
MAPGSQSHSPSPPPASRLRAGKVIDAPPLFSRLRTREPWKGGTSPRAEAFDGSHCGRSSSSRPRGGDGQPDFELYHHRSVDPSFVRE